MKNFLTSMLGTLAGMVLFFGTGALLLFILVVGLVATATQKKDVGPVEKASFLVVDLDMNITDAPAPFDSSALFQSFGGGDKGPVTLQTRQVIRALRAAAKDPKITGILIQGSLQPSGYGSGIAVLREVRAALESFKESQKPVMAYMAGADFKDYYLASVADDFVLDPYGAVGIRGLGSSPMFYAEAFEKFGIGVDVVKVGKYKSAVEPYIRRDMSPEAREQLQALLNDLWSQLRADVAKSRKITTAAIQKLADQDGVILAKAAMEAGLVNRLAYRDEILAELRQRTGKTDAKDDFQHVDLVRYVKTLPAEGPVLPPGQKVVRQDARIAIVYAEGAIVEGHGEKGEVGGDRYADVIRRLREDKQVKAIVLRVNSPGGSVNASEHIQRELRITKAVKPVIISMGSYAASGGYWISAYGDRIFAEQTTVTGSIGVFGVLFNIGELSHKIGLGIDTVKTAERADLGTPFRPKTPAELAVFQRSVDWVNQEFIGKVAEGRKLDPKRVDEIGQGRVWSGAAALKLGLVDEIGSLEQAIAYAAAQADLKGGYNVEEFPRRKGFEEMLTDALEQAGQNARTPRVMEKWIQRATAEVEALEQYNDPRGVYARLPFAVDLP